MIIATTLILGIFAPIKSDAQNTLTQEDFKHVPQGLVTGGHINNDSENLTSPDSDNDMNHGRSTYYPHKDGYSSDPYRYNSNYYPYRYNRSPNRYAPTDRHHPDTDWVEITY
ncbi:hypothetical protein [Halothece sp. PCC 7418]|uniref:hypothetical protein n=1 Tax=Halothece sp. (strain PCC 7418) TaxID=65093 RepID=UPI00123727EC|nr:hypothetical protein [Halothece sp. PCC 7418]